MTAYSPVYRITINNTVVTNVTLSGLTINSGRTSIYSQPVASYCNLSLIETAESAIGFEINDSVTIEVKNSTNVYTPIFGGFITDVGITIQASSANVVTQRIQIIAVGALARLNRGVYVGNVNHQFDGDRIKELISAVLFGKWEDLSSSETWANYGATIDWQNAENVGLGEVDTPGDYELHSENGLNDTLYNLASRYAQSGLGYLYEDSQGRIGYADSTHRAQYLSLNGYVDLNGNNAIGPGLSMVTRAGDVKNKITVGYGISGAEVTAEDLTSIDTYGLLESTIATTLRNQVDAESQAAFYLLIRANPAFSINQITFQLTNSAITNTERDALIGIFMGQALNINNLPTNMVGGRFSGFVEGWTWTASLNELKLTLNISPIQYSLQAFRWTSIPVTETWNTIDPTLEWYNATIVA